MIKIYIEKCNLTVLSKVYNKDKIYYTIFLKKNFESEKKLITLVMNQNRGVKILLPLNKTDKIHKTYSYCFLFHQVFLHLAYLIFVGKLQIPGVIQNSLVYFNSGKQKYQKHDEKG